MTTQDELPFEVTTINTNTPSPKAQKVMDSLEKEVIKELKQKQLLGSSQLLFNVMESLLL